jgi:NAD(P)-dependent dehydrogenase (short-subunit alcohol dehydrogenase family)
VVNDIGGAVDGTGTDVGPAQQVVDEIIAMGGEAVANTDSVADWEGAQRMVNQAVETFGSLDILVNNAGILRDRMLFNMTEEEWDAVIAVHLKGTFSPLRWAAAYWREKAKAGETFDASVINTSSTSGIFANPGQGNYGAAKSGIASLSIIAAKELGRYGVRVNAIAPGARTRMTENLGGNRMPAPAEGEWDERSRQHRAAGDLARQHRGQGHHRPGVPRRWWAGQRRHQLAARSRQGQGRPVGSRRAHRRGAPTGRGGRHRAPCTAASQPVGCDLGHENQTMTQGDEHDRGGRPLHRGPAAILAGGGGPVGRGGAGRRRRARRGRR